MSELPDLIRGRLQWLAENLDDPLAEVAACCLADEITEWVRRPEGYVSREVLEQTLREVMPAAASALYLSHKELVERALRISHGRPPAWFVVADPERMTAEEYEAYARWVMAARLRLSRDPNTGNFRPDRHGEYVTTVGGTMLAARDMRVTWDGNPPGDIRARLREVAERAERDAIGYPVTCEEDEQYRDDDLPRRVAGVLNVQGFAYVRGHEFRVEPGYMVGRLYSELPCLRCGRPVANCYDACSGPPATSPPASAPSPNPD